MDNQNSFQIPVEDIVKFQTWRRSCFYLKTDIAIPDDELRNLRFSQKEVLEKYRNQIVDVCQVLFDQVPKQIVPLSQQGTFHLLYRIVLNNDKSCIFRANSQSSRYTELNFYSEQWVTRAVIAYDIPAVPVSHIDITRSRFPLDYEIVEEAKGTSLSGLEDSTNFHNLLENLGYHIARLHQIETQQFGPLDILSIVGNPENQARGIFSTWKEYIYLNLEKHIKGCFDIDAINTEESARIEKFFSVIPGFYDIKPSLLHGDLGNHNIFSDGQQITGVIDWEDCLSGDPVYDIAFWGTFHPDNRIAAFLSGYKSVQRLPDDFQFRYWLYYLRVSLAKTVHRYRFQYKDVEGRVPASTRIQKSLAQLKTLV